MQEQDKILSREQLIGEMVRICQRVAELEASGTTHDRDRELEAGLVSLRARLEKGGDVSDLLEDLRRQVSVRLECAGTLREGLKDTRLRREIGPWIDSHARETRRIQAVLDGLDRVLSGATSSDRCLGFMGSIFRVNLEPTPVAQSYGPRRVLYPQWISMADDEMAFGPDRNEVHGADIERVFGSLALADP